MDSISRREQYIKELEERGDLPEGFITGSVAFPFSPQEKESGTSFMMNLSAIVLDRPTPVFTGFFTRNLSVGAPVIIGREIVRKELASGVIVNNKIANVCAPGGVENAFEVAGAFKHAYGIEEGEIFPSSTGIIGWKLPVEEMKEGAAHLAKKMLEAPSQSLLPVARGIMTTDTFPKIRSARCGSGTIVATAKGAGMIEPNLATMLVFILTDITISRLELHDTAAEIIDRTFNRISVDSDQSTSDMVLLFSSCRKRQVPRHEFIQALEEVCGPLAEDVVRNGEGTAHVVRVRVEGAGTDFLAVGYGKAVINSLLVKTAIFGNDPNVGRIIMALGDFAGSGDPSFDLQTVEIDLGGYPVFRNGAFRLDEEKERVLSDYLKDCALDYETTGYPQHDRKVEITVRLGRGAGEAEVLGSDLSYGYVGVNADYRT